MVRRLTMQMLWFMVLVATYVGTLYLIWYIRGGCTDWEERMHDAHYVGLCFMIGAFVVLAVSLQGVTF